MAKKPIRRRNAMAAALRSPLFRQRVVKNKKAYRRKEKHRAKSDEVLLPARLVCHNSCEV